MQSKNKWSADDYRRAQEMRQGGCTYKEIAEKTGADVVQVIGSRFVLYKESRDNKQIKLVK